MSRGPLLEDKHHGGLPTDVRDPLQEGEGRLQLRVHEVDEDHQQRLDHCEGDHAVQLAEEAAHNALQVVPQQAAHLGAGQSCDKGVTVM